MEVDEGLYSRQLYVMGHDAQHRLSNSTALIIGLNGLGCEAAKNVILAGLSRVSLYDPTPTTYADLSSNFYLTEEDIGFNRANICAPKLAELNPYVTVNVIEGELNEKLLDGYTVVVIIDLPYTKKCQLAEYCHHNNIYVIISDIYGVFANVFCDFGPEFIVLDSTGENVSSSMIANISNDSPALVTMLEESRHKLETGDVVLLTEIFGDMSCLNDHEFKINVKDPYSFEIDFDTRHIGRYIRGGYCTEVKKPKTFVFKSYTESIQDPGMFVGDFAKFDRFGALHIGFQAIEQFRATYGRLPLPGNKQDAETIYNTSASINASVQGDHYKVDHIENYANIIRRLAMCSRGVISPICGVIGGIVGQEILKACSGKFTPLQQWYYFDSLESLSEEPLPEEEVSPIGCRYDSQIMIFGKTLQKELQSLSMFLVGAGAIGCEVLKTWALMGVSCGSTGRIHVTDMDHIEKSNLSRQFLFRNKDINRPKSLTAANAVIQINPSISIKSYENKVAPETENIFNDDFYDSIDMICTALDNVEARLYVDQRCLFYQKPMLESGTLGTKGNTQVVVPGITESYGATRDPPEQSIPVCTLKHFPNLIAHTLQWAREWFEETYKQTAEDVNTFLASSTSQQYEASLAAQQNMKLDTLTRTYESLVSQKPQSFADCVAWARLRFEDLFTNRIKQLLHNFPLDRMTPAGTPFWSGAKRPPQPIDFDISDPLHFEFIESTANLRAFMFGLTIRAEEAGKESITQVLQQVKVPAFHLEENVKIPTSDEEAKALQEARSSEQDVDLQCSNLIRDLTGLSPEQKTSLAVIDFDKDVDAHMRAVAACSNLRARNYAIPEADLYTSRGIAGRIIPAIATTTALVTGFICLEIYKIIQKKPLTAYSNTFTNLAITLFTSMEPEPPKVTVSVIKGAEWKWTPWDKIIVDAPGITLKGLIDFLEAEYGLCLTMLSSGVSMLYSDFMNKKKMLERMHMPVKEILESLAKKQLPSETKYLILEVLATDLDTDEEVELPYLRLRLY